jgi:ABC-type phosphate transport system substrate-binding protein
MSVFLNRALRRSCHRPRGEVVVRAVSACCVLALATAWLSDARATTDVAAYKIIVHPDNPLQSLDRDFVRGAFLKTAISWSHSGRAIRPIDLAKGQPSRERFTREVLSKTPKQLSSYWIQRIFSGTAVPPPEAESFTAAVAYVLANPGGLAYVPLTLDIGNAKAVRVE